MKGKYKAALALLLLLILVPLTLLMTLGLWVPTLAGIWLPVGTRIALEQSPRLTRHGLVIPDLRYLVNDCSLAHITQAELTHPSRWLLNIKSLKLDAACLAKLPASEASPAAPRTLAQWQSMLPNTWINIDNVITRALAGMAGQAGDLHDAAHSADTLSGRKSKISRAVTRSGIDGEPTGDRRAGQPASR